MVSGLYFFMGIFVFIAALVVQVTLYREEKGEIDGLFLIVLTMTSIFLALGWPVTALCFVVWQFFEWLAKQLNVRK